MFSGEASRGQGIIEEVKETISVIEALRSSLLTTMERIEEFLTRTNAESILHIGCGSSYYASLYGAYPLILQKTTGFALPASEFIYLLDRMKPSPSLLSIFYSRSGETTEITLALEKARSKNIKTIGLTCTPGSTLHRKADISIVVPECLEKSHYMTKSFIGLSLLGTITSHVALQSFSHSNIKTLDSELQTFVEGFKGIYNKYHEIKELVNKTLDKKTFIVLGAESIYAIAQEAGLKLNEVAYTFSHAMHALEFRHGPIALREKAKELQVIVLSASGTHSNMYVERLVNDLRARDFDTILISDLKMADFTVPIKMSTQITYLLLILPMYLFAIERSLQLGYNPDVPRHIERVIKHI
ncbi:MAG: SIS domain-containing protein [Thermofilum sp.]|jgi:glucosamine--fructose-6-phosphate aminotransferase (isomerizing)|nr:SIS domain-containing protein [Thermofilum sp.]